MTECLMIQFPCTNRLTSDAIVPTSAADANADHGIGSPLSTLQSNKFSALTHTITGSLALSKHFTLYTYNGEKCIVRTCGPTALAMPLSVAEMAESRTLRLFDHVNLNRFLGLSLDGPNLLAVWNFCARGALKDVIMSGSAMVRDVVFIQSAIKEICEGLHFLHNSPLQFHGRLKSSACLKMIGGK
ncbi:hypothetical protein niasHT_017224 [Heterodera trifolii]|uniref:Serine-threonine/tyrosine-protein kinase catalytic domain-containing protein n=1 Tax=Heterodera trifolii TaxID=157864 RepID=A0ABD2L374_9BILA